MKKWMRKRLRKWLGIDDLSEKQTGASIKVSGLERQLSAALQGAADVHFRGNTQIVVLSALKGGTIQIYDFNAKDGVEIMERCGRIMGPAFPDAIFDAPPEFKRFATRYTSY